MKAVTEAVNWGKTPLLVADGHANQVDTFFSYGAGCLGIDALQILNQTVLRKTRSTEDIKLDLNRKLDAAVIHGRPIHIAMGRTALPFQQTFCQEDLFPEAVFNNTLLKQSFGDKMNSGCFSLVTTDFSLEGAREHLPAALP